MLVGLVRFRWGVVCFYIQLSLFSEFDVTFKPFSPPIGARYTFYDSMNRGIAYTTHESEARLRNFT